MKTTENIQKSMKMNELVEQMDRLDERRDIHANEPINRK